MTSTAQLTAFTITAVVVIAVPGPSVLFTISRALTVGRRDALLTVVGNAAGVYLQVIAVAFGLGTIVERSIVAFTVVKLVGAAYLVYLGVQAIRHRHAMAAVAEPVANRQRTTRVLRDGLFVGVANPKAIVFFAAALPQFVNHSAGFVPVQMLLLGAIFAGIALVLDSIWATFASTVRGWFAGSPRRLAVLGGSGGVAMIGLGAGLAINGRPN
ncbi:threonine/homoserine/homoserine lactone efflux protein [Tamaricihabitans halophyticus]|uniref:Threonine/homoserine/homoserine lactone efflux protein n=1 Tax=Tamaricihabitans halophyticus TaxID=1262583 RepID=A0A4R2QPT6_9PSEU|nr:LysE family translocator [Tamaricihabitans halophyticus]TCP50974.1 threonine/homoserine/homoserine lactone efflux protein [Tamaricihabitans halophyticus]